MTDRHDVQMRIEGMTCGGCVAAVTRIVQRVDPCADVVVDLEQKRARILTVAAPRALADALAKGGYEADATPV